MYKALVDLEFVKGDIAQLGERGMPGTKVIDRQAEALQAQSGQDLERGPGILHQPRFGHFQYDTLRSNAYFFGKLGNKTQKGQGCKVIHGNINRNAQWQSRFLPS